MPKHPLLSSIALVYLGANLGCAPVERAAGGAPGPALVAGWGEFQLGEFTRAERAFAAVEASAPPGSVARDEAIYGQAAVWNLRRDRRDPARAEALYRRVRDEAGGGSWAAWAALDMARMRHLAQPPLEVDYPAVREAYEAVWRAHGERHPAGVEALVYLANLPRDVLPAAARPRWIAEIEGLLARAPDTPYRSRLHAALAWLHAQSGDQTARLHEWEKAIITREIDPHNPGSNRSTDYLQLAATAENEVGDAALARRYYEKFLAEYPQDNRAYLVNERLTAITRREADLAADGRGRP